MLPHFAPASPNFLLAMMAGTLLVALVKFYFTEEMSTVVSSGGPSPSVGLLW